MTDLLEQARELLERIWTFEPEFIESAMPNVRKWFKDKDAWLSAYSSRAKLVMKVEFTGAGQMWDWLGKCDDLLIERDKTWFKSYDEALSDARACAAALGMTVEIQE